MITRQGNRYLVDGPLTLDNTASLVAEGVPGDGERVIFDLEGVTKVDSSALSLLLEWMRRAGDGGRRVAFANMHKDLRSLAELYGVAKLIPLAD